MPSPVNPSLQLQTNPSCVSVQFPQGSWQEFLSSEHSSKSALQKVYHEEDKSIDSCQQYFKYFLAPQPEGTDS